MVQAHRTSSNLLKPHHDRASRLCRGLSYEFGVVRLSRTYLFTGETRCAGCSSTRSGWFTRIEPPRTCSNHLIAEIARCVEFFPMSLGWFDCTEPSLPAGCLCTSSGWFKRIEPPRTFSNHRKTKLAGRVEVFHLSSGWFDGTEPSLTTSFQGKH